ncbi:MAG: tetratricopeptide repeat protein [Pseudomonadaceae bacterium]|nr:tetratricopeptide repeat protein [Pseudomonadaceae bacterium]
MSVTSSHTSPQRRRGVQASRSKLSEALTAAGHKTQAALADHIADLEGLENAPRDMVNRAFRELPVEPTSLERIARALNVPAHTLYKSSDEPDRDAQGTSRRLQFAVPGKFRGISWLAVLGVLSVALWQWWPELAPQPMVDTGNEALMLGLGNPHIVVMPVTNQHGDTNLADKLTSALRASLATHYQVASATATATLQEVNVQEVASRLRSDIVVEGEVVSTGFKNGPGRLSGVRFFALIDGVRQQFWAESFPTVALGGLLSGIVDRTTIALARAYNPGHADLPHFPLAPVQDDYLAGEALLDAPSNELNLKRAQTRFEAALRQDSNYALAHAGLCQALLEEHWMFEEDRMLQDASRACGQALLLNPEHPVVASAHAHFLTRTGRKEDGLTLYRKITENHPLDASAWTGLAASLLDYYRQTGKEADLTAAKSAARQAADTDPFVWKPLFNLATMQWFSGDVAAAIEVSEEALRRDENEYVLANLGTFYMCRGDFEQARTSYTRARELAPGSYVGDEFLGMAHYFLGEYEVAARLRRRAIDAIGDGAPEVHEMWGQLGDAYRHSGAIEAAIDAYQRAAEIAERDFLRGARPSADNAARAYYYLVLHELDPQRVPDATLAQVLASLDEISSDINEATAHRRMAQIWVLRKAWGKAADAVERATSKCAGYGMLPDFQVLGLQTTSRVEKMVNAQISDYEYLQP